MAHADSQGKRPAAGPVHLRAERLLLRPFETADADAVFDYASDTEWARYLENVPQPFTRSDAEQRVARNMAESWETHPTWAIVFERVVVGDIVLMIDLRNDIGELGYELARKHWGKGLVVEAAEAVIDWGFQERGLAKVFAQCDLRNTRSLRVMEKLRMTREGVLRAHSKVHGERVDDVFYGLLRHEWLEHRGHRQPPKSPAPSRKFNLDEVLPPRYGGKWPEGLSLRREDMYEDRA